MAKPNVLVTHPAGRLATYFGDLALHRLRQVATVHLNPDPHDWSGAELIAAARQCTVLIAYRQTPLDALFFESVPQLLAAVRCAVDIRSIDVAAASQHGVLVTQASPGFGPSVSEWVLGMMLNLSRHITPSAMAYHQGLAAEPLMGAELRGACLGIVGYGEIGRHVARLALAFGMRVCVHDPFVRPQELGIASLSLADLMRCSDHVVCLAPALPETENLVNGPVLSLMKKTAFFINASRGQLVDEQALLHALDHGLLAGAALDVGRAQDQMPSPALAQHPRVLATPHVGGLTPQAIAHQALETVDQTTAILQGRVPKGAVNAASAWRLLKRRTP